MKQSRTFNRSNKFIEIDKWKTNSLLAHCLEVINGEKVQLVHLNLVINICPTVTSYHVNG